MGDLYPTLVAQIMVIWLQTIRPIILITAPNLSNSAIIEHSPFAGLLLRSQLIFESNLRNIQYFLHIVMGKLRFGEVSHLAKGIANKEQSPVLWIQFNAGTKLVLLTATLHCPPLR